MQEVPGQCPTFTTGWLFYYGVSTRHSRLLAAEAPPSRQQGGVEERCKLPNRGLGISRWTIIINTCQKLTATTKPDVAKRFKL